MRMSVEKLITSDGTSPESIRRFAGAIAPGSPASTTRRASRTGGRSSNTGCTRTPCTSAAPTHGEASRGRDRKTPKARSSRCQDARTSDTLSRAVVIAPYARRPSRCPNGIILEEYSNVQVERSDDPVSILARMVELAQAHIRAPERRRCGLSVGLVEYYRALVTDYVEILTQRGARGVRPRDSVKLEPSLVVQRAAESNCLESQEEWPATVGVRSHQGERCLSMELRITSSLRMQAVRANFFGLPAASSRW